MTVYVTGCHPHSLFGGDAYDDLVLTFGVVQASRLPESVRDTDGDKTDGELSLSCWELY